MPELQPSGRTSLIALAIAALVLAIIAISVKFGATEAVRHMAAVHAARTQ